MLRSDVALGRALALWLTARDPRARVSQVVERFRASSTQALRRIAKGMAVFSRGAPPGRNLFRSGGFFLRASTPGRRKTDGCALRFGTVMDPTRVERGIFVTRLVDRRRLCREHFEITLSVENFPSARPGQFIQVLCRPPDAPHTAELGGRFLRRPFSIAGLTRSGHEIRLEIVGRVVGSGTTWLSERSVGAAVGVLGPLGRPFSTPAERSSAILIAGGVGIPPIRWLAEYFRACEIDCVTIVGARTRDLLPVTLVGVPSTNGTPVMCVDAFARHDIRTTVTTDDGSCGLRGRTTDALAGLFKKRSLPDGIRVAACGPPAMLRAVGRMCIERGVSCELALERVMGCGMGTCQSCVVRVKDASAEAGWRYALCCREGPIFEARQLSWA